MNVPATEQRPRRRRAACLAAFALLVLLGGCGVSAPTSEEMTQAVFDRMFSEGCLASPDQQVVLHKKLDERRYMTEVRLSVIQTRKCIWNDHRSFRSVRNGDETAETVTDIRAYLVVVKATLARPNDAWIVDDYQIVSVAGPVR